MTKNNRVKILGASLRQEHLGLQDSANNMRQVKVLRSER